MLPLSASLSVRGGCAQIRAKSGAWFHESRNHAPDFALVWSWDYTSVLPIALSVIARFWCLWYQMKATVTYKTIAIFRTFWMGRLYLHHFWLNDHDSTTNRKVCILAFPRHANHVIWSSGSGDILYSLEQVHGNSFVAGPNHNQDPYNSGSLILGVPPLGLQHSCNPPRHALNQVPALLD